jgi:hypothetical protein
MLKIHLDEHDEVDVFSFDMPLHYSFAQNEPDLMAGNITRNFDYKILLYKFAEQFDIGNFIKEIRTYSPEFYPILRIYYLNFLIFSNRDDDDKHFLEMRELVWENIHKFSRFEKHTLMLFLESGASIKIKDGKLKFVDHIHEIHKKMLKENLYDTGDYKYFHYIRFWKIVSNALRLGQFEWTRNFIEEYSPMLWPEQRDHMKNYSYVRCILQRRVEQPQFRLKGQALMFIRYDLMILRIKCYYELGRIEDIFYYVDSFKHLLKTDSSPDWAKRRFKNFMFQFDHLIKIREKEQSSRSDIEIYMQKLKNADEVLEKGWLLEKAGLLH